MPSYFYAPHEKASFEYTVQVGPPPADVAKAEFRRQSPTGPIFHTEALVACGSSTLTVPLTRFEARRDSPVFVDFVFEKKHEKVRQKRQAVTHALSLAETEPAEIVTPAAYPGEEVELKVSQWGAVAFDRPGRPTLFREPDPKRVQADVKKNVRWTVDGKELATKGESVKYKPTDAQVGRKLKVQAFIKEAKNGAKGELKVIAVTKVTPEADVRFYVNQDADEASHHGRFFTVKATIDEKRKDVPVSFELQAPATNKSGLAAKDKATILAAADKTDAAAVQTTVSTKTDVNGVATAHLRLSTVGGDQFSVTATTAPSHKLKDKKPGVVSSKRLLVWQKLYFDVVEMKRPTGGGVFEWKAAIEAKVIAAFADAFVELKDTTKRHKGDYVRNFESVDDGMTWADRFTDGAGAPWKVHFCIVDSAHPAAGTYGATETIYAEAATSPNFKMSQMILPHDTVPGWLVKAEFKKRDGTWATFGAGKVTLDGTRGYQKIDVDFAGSGVVPSLVRPVPVRVKYKKAFPAGGWGGTGDLHLLICRGFYEDNDTKGMQVSPPDQEITTACIHEPGHALGLVPATAAWHDAVNSAHCKVGTCAMWYQSVAGNFKFHPETAAKPDSCRAMIRRGMFVRSYMATNWKWPRK